MDLVALYRDRLHRIERQANSFAGTVGHGVKTAFDWSWVGASRVIAPDQGWHGATRISAVIGAGLWIALVYPALHRGR